MKTPDGLQLHVETWEVDNPKAMIVLVHGLGEHIGRYQHVAAALNQAGYTVIGVDHRGHGKSEGEPRVYVQNIDTYVDDLKLLWDQVKQPALPMFMLGHSMGGMIALRFTLRYQNEMAGLVASASGLIRGSSISAMAEAAAKILGKLAPNLNLVALDTKFLSRDKTVVQAYVDDPLVFHGKLRVGIGAALVVAGQDVLARAHTLTLPLLLLHGEADAIVSPEASQRVYADASSSDKALKIYPNLYHEIMNEPEQDQVLNDILSWLAAHVN